MKVNEVANWGTIGGTEYQEPASEIGTTQYTTKYQYGKIDVDSGEVATFQDEDGNDILISARGILKSITLTVIDLGNISVCSPPPVDVGWCRGRLKVFFDNSSSPAIDFVHEWAMHLGYYGNDIKVHLPHISLISYFQESNKARLVYSLCPDMIFDQNLEVKVKDGTGANGTRHHLLLVYKEEVT